MTEYNYKQRPPTREYADHYDLIDWEPKCKKHPDQPLLKCEKCREEHWDNYNEKRGPYSETTSD